MEGTKQRQGQADRTTEAFSASITIAIVTDEADTFW